MKRLLPLLITVLALLGWLMPKKVPYKITETEANRMILGQILSTCYGVSTNHITMKQKIDILGFGFNSCREHFPRSG